MGPVYEYSLSIRNIPPPSIIINVELEFDISKILDSKMDKCHKYKLQYLVEWAGYKGNNEETS